MCVFVPHTRYTKLCSLFSSFLLPPLCLFHSLSFSFSVPLSFCLIVLRALPALQFEKEAHFILFIFVSSIVLLLPSLTHSFTDNPQFDRQSFSQVDNKAHTHQDTWDEMSCSRKAIQLQFTFYDLESWVKRGQTQLTLENVMSSRARENNSVCLRYFLPSCFQFVFFPFAYSLCADCFILRDVNVRSMSNFSTCLLHLLIFPFGDVRLKKDKNHVRLSHVTSLSVLSTCVCVSLSWKILIPLASLSPLWNCVCFLFFVSCYSVTRIWVLITLSFLLYRCSFIPLRPSRKSA